MSEVDHNVEGERDPDLIRATGTGHGISFNGQYGLVWNCAKYGEIYDLNGNIIFRENCASARDVGKYLSLNVFQQTHMISKTLFLTNHLS